MNTKPGSFKLDSFEFTQASFNFSTIREATLIIDIQPSGRYEAKLGKYHLSFQVTVAEENSHSNILRVLCEADFSFNEVLEYNSIPEYFYPNSLAIIFPYVRAFVSNISLQANVRPIILPTVNLMGLTANLKLNTEVIE